MEQNSLSRILSFTFFFVSYHTGKIFPPLEIYIDVWGRAGWEGGWVGDWLVGWLVVGRSVGRSVGFGNIGMKISTQYHGIIALTLMSFCFVGCACYYDFWLMFPFYITWLYTTHTDFH